MDLVTDGCGGLAADPARLLEDPMWAALAPATPPGGTVMTWLLDTSSPLADMRRLGDRVRASPPGTGILVVGERRCLRLLVQERRHPARWWRAPNVGQLVATLERGGVAVAQPMLAWPSGRSARVVGLARAPASWRWAQRTGVLGGGGAQRLVRRMMRSILTAPLIRPLTSGVALIGTRR